MDIKTDTEIFYEHLKQQLPKGWEVLRPTDNEMDGEVIACAAKEAPMPGSFFTSARLYHRMGTHFVAHRYDGSYTNADVYATAITDMFPTPIAAITHWELTK